MTLEDIEKRYVGLSFEEEREGEPVANSTLRDCLWLISRVKELEADNKRLDQLWSETTQDCLKYMARVKELEEQLIDKKFSDHIQPWLLKINRLENRVKELERAIEKHRDKEFVDDIEMLEQMDMWNRELYAVLSKKEE